jgi:hypothetical protein
MPCKHHCQPHSWQTFRWHKSESDSTLPPPVSHPSALMPSLNIKYCSRIIVRQTAVNHWLGEKHFRRKSLCDTFAALQAPPIRISPLRRDEALNFRLATRNMTLRQKNFVLLIFKSFPQNKFASLTMSERCCSSICLAVSACGIKQTLSEERASKQI